MPPKTDASRLAERLGLTGSSQESAAKPKAAPKHKKILNPEVPGHPLNDSGNALRLQDLHGEDMRWVPELKAWLVWDGRVWADDPAKANAKAVSVTDAIRKQAKETKDKRTAATLSRFATVTGNDSKLTAMLRQAAALPGMSLSLSSFDSDPALLTVLNGTLVLDDDVVLYEHEREDYCRTCVPVDYDSEAESELWEDVLDTFLPDPEVREYFQRLAGYILFGANSERKLVFLIGPSSTGKTTVLELISRTLGPGFAGPFSLSLFREKGQDAPRPDMLTAMGRRFIHTTEATAEWKLHADTIKRITGADQITARGMFSNKFLERIASFIPWVATNAYPRIEHADAALWKRLIAIPFEKVVIDDNPNFVINFPDDELAGILRWMVEGYEMYRKKGLGDEPEAVKKATALLRTSLSIVDRWISERCEISPEYAHPATALFLDFQGWCTEEAIPERERDHYTQNAFGRILTDRGYAAPDHPERIGPRSGDKKARLRHGLRIRHETAELRGEEIRTPNTYPASGRGTHRVRTGYAFPGECVPRVARTSTRAYISDFSNGVRNIRNI